MENPFEILDEKLNRIISTLSSLKSDIEILKDRVISHGEIMNMAEAAEFLSMSKSTLYGYTFQRKIPHSKVGKRNFFKKDELLEWATKNKIQTMEEIEQEASNYIIRNRRKW